MASTTSLDHVPYNPDRVANAIPSKQTICVYESCNVKKLADSLSSLDPPVRMLQFECDFEVQDVHINVVSNSSRCHQIEVLIIQGNRSSAISARAIQNLVRACSGVKILRLVGVAAVNGPTFATILESCHRLEYLEVSAVTGSNNQVSDNTVIYLDPEVTADGVVHLPNLKELVLINQDVCDDIASAISVCRKGLAITIGEGAGRTWYNNRIVFGDVPKTEAMPMQHTSPTYLLNDDLAEMERILQGFPSRSTPSQQQPPSSPPVQKSAPPPGRHLGFEPSPPRARARAPAPRRNIDIDQELARSQFTRAQARELNRHNQGWYQEADPSDPGLVESFVKPFHGFAEYRYVRDRDLEKFMYQKEADIRREAREAKRRAQKGLKKHNGETTMAAPPGDENTVLKGAETDEHINESDLETETDDEEDEDDDRSDDEEWEDSDVDGIGSEYSTEGGETLPALVPDEGKDLD